MDNNITNANSLLLLLLMNSKHENKVTLNEKQVDILISKNQALQILYLKHCVYKTT